MMPSTNYIMAPSSTSIPTKATINLQIGSPKKLAARRFITMTKTHIGNGDNLKRLRALTRYPPNRDMALHRTSTLPEVINDRRANTEPRPCKSSGKEEILRVSSYPEITLKRQKCSFTSTESRKCSSESFRSENNSAEVKSLMIESGNSQMHSQNDKRTKKKHDRILASVTIVDSRPLVSVKSIVQNSSKTSISVKQAINRYIALAERQHGSSKSPPMSGKTTEDEEKSNKKEQKHAITNTKSVDIKRKQRPKSLDKECSSVSKKHFKTCKPTISRVITDSPACMFKLFGPILLSAPHGIKLWRGGTEGRRKRIHYREVYITEIVLRLSAEINRITGYPSSFVIWDRRMAMPADCKNLDPNYLTEKQFPHSPFHEAVVLFKKYGLLNKFPLLHIDVHGKKNRKMNMDLDIGFKAMENHWPDQSFVKWLKSTAEAQFENAFNSPKCEKNDMRFTVNVDPTLCGDWGGDLFTMACQSVTSGIPGFQLEIPRAMRGQLIEDDELISNFAQSIVNIYNSCINGGQYLYINIPQKERNQYAEYLHKVYQDHLKIDKTFPEKQI